MILACIACDRVAVGSFPEGWTEVREFPEGEEWYTHVGYCCSEDCQRAAREDSEEMELGGEG